MLDDIYNQRVLELAANIPRLGRLESPDASARAHSRLCGSTVVVDLCVKAGRVVDFAHEVRACALGQASSSLMARHAVGATAEELLALRETMTRMLKANG
ncbi:MAG: iron-sulfur cluster assembly scaffold protein, partial [Hyphomicrobiales bacterium]|nr:iron-sulfur cluster assembly scaffold protein [Hyphomicrobiales bacterium]